MNDYVDWLKKNKITEVECMIPDNSGTVSYTHLRAHETR